MKKIILAIICFIIYSNCDLSAAEKNKSVDQQTIKQSTKPNPESTFTKDNTPQSKSETYFWLMTSVIGAIAVYLVFLRFKNQNRYDQLINEIDSLSTEFRCSLERHNSSHFGNKQSDINTSSSQKEFVELRSYMASLNSRISELESKLDSAKSLGSKDHCPSDVRDGQLTNRKDVYLGNVKGTFFNDVFESCRDEAKFKATITGDVATFEPIDLNRISSLDNIGNAVKYEGDVQLNVAKSFVVEKKGEVHKQDNVWLIDEPVVVKLIK